jgi:hypothetical protein
LSYRSDVAGNVQVQVMDVFGRLHFSAQLAMNEGLNTHRLQLPASLEKGIYLISVDGKPGIRLVRD